MIANRMKSIGMPAIAGGSGRAPVAAHARAGNRPATGSAMRHTWKGRAIDSDDIGISGKVKGRSAARFRFTGASSLPDGHRRRYGSCRPAFFRDADCNRAGVDTDPWLGQGARLQVAVGPDPCFSLATRGSRRGHCMVGPGRSPGRGRRRVPVQAPRAINENNAAMALTRSISRLDVAPVSQTVGDAVDRGPLLALSQRKLNALGTPVAYVDRNQRYRFANKALLDWFGKRADEVLGHEVIEVLGRESYQLYRAYVDAALGGERTGYEWQLVTPGRPPIWIRVDYYPDRNQQGHIRGFLATYSDVDHLKRLELEAGQREHRLRLVTDSVGLPILHFDRQLRLRFAN